MKRYADTAVTAVIGFCIFEGITDGSVSVNPLLWVVLGRLAGKRRQDLCLHFSAIRSMIIL